MSEVEMVHALLVKGLVVACDPIHVLVRRVDCGREIYEIRDESRGVAVMVPFTDPAQAAVGFCKIVDAYRGETRA
jgi:hypothetical protein